MIAGKKLFTLFFVLLIGLGCSAVGAQQLDAFIGEIKMFAGPYAPAGWFFCHGQTLKIMDHQALFAVIQNKFGGDGRTNFKLPDLRGRFPIGADAKFVIGQNNADEETKKSKSASKKTKIDEKAEKVVKAWPGVNDSASVKVPTVKVDDDKDDDDDDELPPYLGINYIICGNGIFPARD